MERSNAAQKRKNHLLFSITVLAGLTLTPAAINITNSGDTFSPDSVMIKTTDTVIFTLASIHNVQEVSQATYNANGTTPLTPGPAFSTPYGGGKVIGAAAGTHYFVCQTHASMGMKGQLVVQSVTATNPVAKNLSTFTFQIAGFEPIAFNMPLASARITIVDVQGRTVWSMAVRNGVQNLSWNGKLSDGNYVAAGAYFVQLTALDAAQKPIATMTQTLVQMH